MTQHGGLNNQNRIGLFVGFFQRDAVRVTIRVIIGVDEYRCRNRGDLGHAITNHSEPYIT